MAVRNVTPYKPILTADIANSTWEYRDGNLYAKKQLWNSKKSRIGVPVGSVNSTGYRHVYINNVEYLAHRVIWLMHHGRWPEKHIDHINGIKDDNRIENLRLASYAENAQAGRNGVVRTDNKSRYRGVSRACSGNGWIAQITAFKIKRHLGTFRSREEAAEAYNKASRELCGKFSYENNLQRSL